ncbi:Neurexin-4, partial [Armadillidium nasatum]
MINGEEVLNRTSQVRQINFKGKTQMLQADCDCNMEEESLVSFLTYDSYLNLYRDSSNESFSITFKVKSKGGNILQGLVYSQNGVYPWKLKFEEQRMILTLSTPDKVYLVAPQNMDKKDWLEVVLTLDGKNLALVVNDQRDSMSLDSNITIDDKLTFTGFVGCLKAIVLDGNPQDLRSYIGTSVSRDVVGGCQKTLLATAEDCPTGSFCSVQSTFDCEKEIYEGNCHLEVFCEFHKNGYTFTIVDHNIPQRFTNVKNKAKYFLVNVQYREFTAEGLRYLISTSEECYQDVKISCGDMTTFYKQVSFSSAFLAGIDHLGDRHFGVCHCTGFEDCYQSTSQNSTNKNGYRIVNQTALPILQLKIQREDSDDAPYSEPHLSLGKLYCKNNEIKNEPIAFLSSKSSLILRPWIEGELLLRFRTSSKNSLLIHYGMPSKSQSVTFTTSYPMNEGQWNALWIDVVQNSFRIIFNDQIKFSNFNNENVMHLMDGFFILGNIPKEYRNDKDKDIDNGLIGCYSPIRLNNKALNTSELISNSYKSQEISLGCKGACDENPCQNGATCLEKWTSYECSCVNPFAHLGINCENNLNTNAVTLFSSTEAVYYNSGFVDESVSPLTSNFTFNIKTNEPNCILFVAMDYLQNIIQIHLENSTIIRLLLNFGDELAELKIDTGEYSLNKGQSLQIVVERFQNRTDLLVFTQNQTFSSTLDRGITLITEEDYKQYPYEVQNQLIQYQHSFTVPEKFSLIFIGGVKSYGATSNLPGLIGCFRGLRINETIMNFSDVMVLPTDAKVKCDERSEVCRNGGSCSDTFNSTSEEGSFVCNCEGTSYIGLHCDEEIAYTFNGREDGIGLTGWSFLYNETLRISFAFRSESFESVSNLLLFLKLNNTRSSESENISIVLYDDRILLKSWRGKEIYLENNLEELQERHFVQVTFNSSEILFS